MWGEWLGWGHQDLLFPEKLTNGGASGDRARPSSGSMSCRPGPWPLSHLLLMPDQPPHAQLSQAFCTPLLVGGVFPLRVPARSPL